VVAGYVLCSCECNRVRCSNVLLTAYVVVQRVGTVARSQAGSKSEMLLCRRRYDEEGNIR
jgi:hypothetical protein